MNINTLSGSTAKFLHIISTATSTAEKTIALIPVTKDELFNASFSLYASIASQENIQRIRYTKLICGHFLGIVQAIVVALWLTVKNDDVIPVLLQFAALIRQGLTDETTGEAESIEPSSDATEDATEELAEEAIEPSDDTVIDYATITTDTDLSTAVNPVVSSKDAIEPTLVVPKNNARKSEGGRSKRASKKRGGFVRVIG